MTANRFLFKGGTEKVHEGNPEEQVYKFFLFSILKDRELIFYEALKQGLIKSTPREPHEVERERSQMLNNVESYVCFSPEVKIFIRSQGFGVRRAYYSFFFRFDKTVPNMITIKPFGPNTMNFSFQGRGRFLTNEEVKDRYGEESPTYTYYCRQTYLSKTELRKLVSIGSVDSQPQQVRVLRV